MLVFLMSTCTPWLIHLPSPVWIDWQLSYRNPMWVFVTSHFVRVVPHTDGALCSNCERRSSPSRLNGVSPGMKRAKRLASLIPYATRHGLSKYLHTPGSEMQNVTFASVSAKNAKWRVRLRCHGRVQGLKRYESGPAFPDSTPHRHPLPVKAVCVIVTWKRRPRYSHGCAVIDYSDLHDEFLVVGSVDLLAGMCSAYQACFYRHHCLYLPSTESVLEKHYARSLWHYLHWIFTHLNNLLVGKNE